MSTTPLDDQAARSYRVFPGWYMLGIAAAAQYLSAPGQSYSVAAFKDPMRTDLGISETDFSLAYALATVVSGVALPFVGRMMDRHGARLMLPTIAALLGIACLTMAGVRSLTGIYFSFTFVRSLGQGALTLASVWLVGEWFQRRRGLATALSGLGSSLSVMTIPLLNGFVITYYGWRTAWAVLAIAVWVVLVVPSFLFIRNRPEDIGLRPDGETGNDDETRISEGASPDPMTETSWTVREVLRDSTFWKLLAVPATSGLIATGLVFHQVLLLGSRGVSEQWALLLISLQALVATLTSVGAGWLSDRFSSRLMLICAMLLLVAAVTTVLVMPFPAIAIGYAVILGLHGSILRSAGLVIWLEYYGRINQGGIRGVAFSVMILGSALGPLPMALSVDYFNSYGPALFAFIIVPVIAACIVWTAPAPLKYGPVGSSV